MKFYKTKNNKISGSNFSEVHTGAQVKYKKIKKKTKRNPYLRSTYFKKSKIFLNLFWSHLYEKPNLKDKTRRLKFFLCAIELIENTRYDPESKNNPNKQSEILHRFFGETPEGEKFCVQIKEETRTDNKYLMSIFPFEEK